MGQYEDYFHYVYQQVEEKGILKEFKNELTITSSKEENKYKSAKEIWEIAYFQVINSTS